MSRKEQATALVKSAENAMEDLENKVCTIEASLLSSKPKALDLLSKNSVRTAFVTIFMKHANYPGYGWEKAFGKSALKRTRVLPWRFCLCYTNAPISKNELQLSNLCTIVSLRNIRVDDHFASHSRKIERFGNPNCLGYLKKLRSLKEFHNFQEYSAGKQVRQVRVQSKLRVIGLDKLRD
ncbi:hypothetical protein WN51_14128 [Melipona quadrifasciata]|uniref:Uncharacterized protein n=1 Tax=Melipona quadrifasciata TaxID=166423 RepID=A0A0N0BG50_9HYME|nr:hypothetical protein WN51_14128 [Melipona quadrifasciata]